MSDRTAETVPMKVETLEALKGSIAKWEAIVAGTGRDEGEENCPLCQLFHCNYRKDDEASCVGCPVFERTERRFCGGTPHVAYCNAHSKKSEAHFAQAELDFLKSLLPEQAT